MILLNMMSMIGGGLFEALKPVGLCTMLYASSLDPYMVELQDLERAIKDYQRAIPSRFPEWESSPRHIAVEKAPEVKEEIRQFRIQKEQEYARLLSRLEQAPEYQKFKALERELELIGRDLLASQRPWYMIFR